MLNNISKASILFSEKVLYCIYVFAPVLFRRFNYIKYYKVYTFLEVVIIL